jgi:hypothetical protein
VCTKFAFYVQIRRWESAASWQDISTEMGIERTLLIKVYKRINSLMYRNYAPLIHTIDFVRVNGEVATTMAQALENVSLFSRPLYYSNGNFVICTTLLCTHHAAPHRTRHTTLHNKLHNTTPHHTTPRHATPYQHYTQF